MPSATAFASESSSEGSGLVAYRFRGFFDLGVSRGGVSTGGVGTGVAPEVGAGWLTSGLLASFLGRPLLFRIVGLPLLSRLVMPKAWVNAHK